MVLGRLISTGARRMQLGLQAALTAASDHEVWAIPGENNLPLASSLLDYPCRSGLRQHHGGTPGSSLDCR